MVAQKVESEFSEFMVYKQLVAEIPDEECAAAFDGYVRERFDLIDDWLRTLKPEEITHDAVKKAYTKGLTLKTWWQIVKPIVFI